MPRLEEKIHAPEFGEGEWWNGGPVTLAALRGKPLLVDFWDYTCVNCIRTLPYLREWHARYASFGLTIVGVHAPEFGFAKDATNVERGIREHGLEYPILLDGAYKTWQAYANKYWPAKYLVDGAGYIRYAHFGEGAYEETELEIQSLIRETTPEATLPPPMAPLRDTDVPGAACYRVTPELYLGWARGRIGNPTGYEPDRVAVYRDPGIHAEGYFYAEGPFFAADDALRSAGDPANPSFVRLRYTAREVNLVMDRAAGPEGRRADAFVRLRLDGKPIPGEARGEDVERQEGTPGVRAREPRMVRLVKHEGVETHTLELSTESPGVGMYVFTFVSCAASSP